MVRALSPVVARFERSVRYLTGALYHRSSRNDLVQAREEADRESHARGRAPSADRRAVDEVQPLPRDHLEEGARSELGSLPQVRAPFPAGSTPASRASAR